jgi:hypothetical protein
MTVLGEGAWRGDGGDNVETADPLTGQLSERFGGVGNMAGGGGGRATGDPGQDGGCHYDVWMLAKRVTTKVETWRHLSKNVVLSASSEKCPLQEHGWVLPWISKKQT